MRDNEKSDEFAQRSDEVTRREWILRLSEFVALAGVSGMIPELSASPGAQQKNTTVLPPGLYEPSQDHLVHALSSEGKTWSPPLGSETEYFTPTLLPYHPQFFSPKEFSDVIRIIEILLGKVDAVPLSQAAQWFDLWLHSAAGVRAAAQRLDPMHRSLAVAFYGEASVRELESTDPSSAARMGLRALYEFSQHTYARDFTALTGSEQVDLVTSLAKVSPGNPLRQLFELTRTQAIRGYYTSVAGLKDLDYRGNAYYGDCPGCEKKE